MSWIVHNLWLIPALPLLAAGITALCKQRSRALSASLAIGSMVLSFGLSCDAFLQTLRKPVGDEAFRQVFNFTWLQFGSGSAGMLPLGWVLDPLTAIMAMMVCFVGLLIFIYSVGYMAHDENFTRFFCFLSLFAAAMLGVVIANSLLLLFISWELVGLTSYLLIGFWYHKPSAAAAAKKAFITTRVGDIGFFIGMIWLYGASGTLLFYDGGKGCLETGALTKLVAMTTSVGMAASTAIGLLIFCGAIGKSGQVPLHVWLPDAMEGPTPVSALIHAATMVAAGVFLVARVYPLMRAGGSPEAVPATLQVVTWVGAITAIFAACIAVAQNDIKRILAYSTVSQLGYMMMGLGVGGVVVGMFHLITHAFFKALLFLGSGSVIHGCDEEQDIRRMGGLRKYMPVTFATYAIGMMALSGVPICFSGFWSKDEILHAAHGWHPSHWPFYLGAFGALLTAFYMTRQVCYVFFGEYRSRRGEEADTHHRGTTVHAHPPTHVGGHTPHESPWVMTLPLVVLAFFAVVLGFVGTPAWPWFQSYLGGEKLEFDFAKLTESGVLTLMLLSAVIVFAGIGLGWWFYGRKPVESAEQPDPLERIRPDLFGLLRGKFYVDELYEATVIYFNAWWAGVCDFFDRWVWGGAVLVASYLVLGLSWLDRAIDEYVVNLGFDKVCLGLRRDGAWMSLVQNGKVQRYLGVIGLALAVLVLLLIWGITPS